MIRSGPSSTAIIRNTKRTRSSDLVKRARARIVHDTNHWPGGDRRKQQSESGGSAIEGGTRMVDYDIGCRRGSDGDDGHATVAGPFRFAAEHGDRAWHRHD